MGAQLPANQSYTHLAYGAHNVIAAGLDRTVHMIDGSSGSVLQVIEDAHIQLTYLQWSPVPRRIGANPRPLCTSHASLQHHIRVSVCNLAVLAVLTWRGPCLDVTVREHKICTSAFRSVIASGHFSTV